jgi:hypothetical protein
MRSAADLSRIGSLLYEPVKPLLEVHAIHPISSSQTWCEQRSRSKRAPLDSLYKAWIGRIYKAVTMERLNRTVLAAVKASDPGGLSAWS